MIDIKQAQLNLNNIVMYTDAKNDIKSKYILQGIIVRKKDNAFVYQAELLDIKSARSIVLSDFDSISLLEKRGQQWNTQ